LNFEFSNIRALLIAVCLALPASTAAQVPVAAQPSPDRKWEITDNSFLVEEAFNQERGVVQNILAWTRARGGTWNATFTQEWPVPAMTHQLSYTLVYANNGDARGIGDALVNYRFQLRQETAGGPAIAPRLSVILPTGNESEGLGDGTAGLQMNLPFSKQFGDLYVHANVGYTWLPSVQRTSVLAGSGIWRVSPMLNLMLEGVVALHDSATISPGLRRGWNIGDHQLVIGVAAPITRENGGATTALLTYFSYELPFR
jgi:hypothetical protein